MPDSSAVADAPGRTAVISRGNRRRRLAVGASVIASSGESQKSAVVHHAVCSAARSHRWSRGQCARAGAAAPAPTTLRLSAGSNQRPEVVEVPLSKGAGIDGIHRGNQVSYQRETVFLDLCGD
jgi:hypothetical protein